MTRAMLACVAGDYFELIARQTCGSTKSVAVDGLTWFAIEVRGVGKVGRRIVECACLVVEPGLVAQQ